MKIEALREDFRFLYAALLKHPSFFDGTQKERDFTRLYESKKEKVCSYDSLIDAGTELTVFFRDGHTNLEVPYSIGDPCIPFRLEWTEQGGLILDGKGYEEIPANARIAAVNGVTVENLISLMLERIPHENRYLVMSRMILYPYQNYHLFSERSLKYLFGAKDSYDVSFSVNGETVKKRCGLKEYDGFLDFDEDGGFADYEIQGQRMIFRLKACRYDENYRAMLETMAWLCRERQITSFVLDLSRNMGGNSAVIDEFISYTDVDYFRRYEMIDYSSGEARQISSRRELVKNRKKPFCFPKELLCRVSCHTFSSARTFAVTLKDNGIARIIGTNTGGKPDSYGLPVKLQMPESKLRFRVSTSRFLRPDEQREDALTLEAD
ncbi:MAG: S41 family peptidase [bacterium]|nr:S41 family peptidase [bacterium]